MNKCNDQFKKFQKIEIMIYEKTILKKLMKYVTEQNIDKISICGGILGSRL